MCRAEILSRSRVFHSHNPPWKLVKAIDFLFYIIVARCRPLGNLLYQGGCIFPFPNSIFKLHFNDLEPCVVQQLLVFWNTQQQIDKESKCSVRAFSIPCLPVCFLRAGPWCQLQGILLSGARMTLWTTVVCQRTALDSSRACGEPSTDLCTGAQGRGDREFWTAARAQNLKSVLLWNAETSLKTKWRKQTWKNWEFHFLFSSCR